MGREVSPRCPRSGVLVSTAYVAFLVGLLKKSRALV